MAQNHNFTYPLLHPFHKKQILILYLFILLNTAYFVWNTLNTFEAFIITASNRLAAFIYDRPFDNSPDQDLSLLEITTDSHLNILVQFPNGKKAGDTSDDIRFSQTNHTTINETLKFSESATKGSSRTYIWQLATSQPPIGTYQLILTTKHPGNYPLTIKTSDRNGLYTKQIDKNVSINPNQKITYQLRFHKDIVYRTQLKQRFRLTELALLPFKLFTLPINIYTSLRNTS